METSEKRSIIVCNHINRKIPDARESNVAEHYHSYFKRKNTKLVVTELPKTSNKLSKTKRQAKNVFQADLGKVPLVLYIMK